MIHSKKQLTEPFPIKGTLYVYDGKVTIDEHLAGIKTPAFVINNLIPTVGRAYIMGGSGESLADIDACCLGDNATARALSDTDLKSLIFTASPTDARVSGTKRITELFVGINEANFTHREFGLKANGTLISTLVLTPEFVKTTAKTRTYIHSLGWL